MCSPWQNKLKLNYMKNPSFGELRSLCQIKQVCKEENQRRNLTFSNFAMLCETFASLAKCQKKYKLQDREQNFEESISHPVRNFATLANLRKMNLTTHYEIFISLAKPKLKKINFALCAKFRKHCEIFLCNLQIFLHQLC